MMERARRKNGRRRWRAEAGAGLAGTLGRAARAGLVAVVVAAGPQPASAESKTVPESREQIRLSFAPLVKKVAPAVVNIHTRKVVRRRSGSPLLSDPFFRRFFGEDLPFGRTEKRVQTSLGSGVIVDAEGLIITSHHVIKGSEEITVALADRREFEAALVLMDKRTDLAVLRIDAGGEKLPFLELRDSDDLEVGDLVLAIGNPFGVGQTVTSGIVSGLARTTVGVADFRFFIQTDAAINPGNSGGALVTMDGGLIGINTAIYSRGGGSNGVGFAVPSSMVKAVLAGIAAGGKVVRPWLGAAGQAVTPEIASALGLSLPSGVLISKVYPGGPADAAGLEVGDLVTAVNGRGVDDPEALQFRFATLPVGGEAKLSVLHKRRNVSLTVALLPPPEDPPRNVTTLEGFHPLAGVTVANLSPALVEELSLAVEPKGVVVLGVARRSLARRFGMRPNDLIRAVNGEDASSVEALKGILSNRASTWRIELSRGGRVMQMVISG